jgi:hypothetical protein
MPTASPRQRTVVVQWLAAPALRQALADAWCRFDAGEDPLPYDERGVEQVLQARAWLEATAPSPDPLAAELAAVDASWQALRDVAWLLTDERWRGCFEGLPPPSPAVWWGARSDPSIPSKSAVLRALVALGGSRV